LFWQWLLSRPNQQQQQRQPTSQTMSPKAGRFWSWRQNKQQLTPPPIFPAIRSSICRRAVWPNRWRSSSCWWPFPFAGLSAAVGGNSSEVSELGRRLACLESHEGGFV